VSTSISSSFENCRVLSSMGSLLSQGMHTYLNDNDLLLEDIAGERRRKDKETRGHEVHPDTIPHAAGLHILVQVRSTAAPGAAFGSLAAGGESPLKNKNKNTWRSCSWALLGDSVCN